MAGCGLLMIIDWSFGLTIGAVLGTGYLLGSMPFGVILTRLASVEDVRSVGSGNIGATNVLRTGRIDLAAGTLVGDALKGTFAVVIVQYSCDRHLAFIAAFGAFLGHLFPFWLKFRGGKGVATYIGVLLALAWPVALVFCLLWLIVAGFTRYSSLSGLVASAATPAILWTTGNRLEASFFLLLTVIVWVRHRQNILRIITGTERKIDLC